MRQDRERMLKDLDQYRWALMLQLADEAEDSEKLLMANGWRWLANNERWPDNRIDHKYGWTFKQYINRANLDLKTHRATRHTLPDALLNQEIKLYPIPNLPLLMSRTARAVGSWLEGFERGRRQWREAHPIRDL